MRHKFNAKPTVVDDIWFASKLEARYYEHLQMIKSNSKDLLFFLRQTPLHLPESEKYVLDFVEFWADGTVEFVDVKGRETREFLRKKKTVERHFPFDIKVVKKVP